MKVYTVCISSYETDNSCATYDYSEDYPTFEEAQEALENSFWAFEDLHSLTKRQSKYNRNTNSFEEIPDSRYYYSFEITPNNFCISGDWSDYSGYIEENEISESLPFGHWRYIDRHGLPKEKGIYLISRKTPQGNVTTYSYFDPDTRIIDNKDYDYCEGFFESPYMEHEYWKVYAWTETIEPAQDE